MINVQDSVYDLKELSFLEFLLTLITVLERVLSELCCPVQILKLFVVLNNIVGVLF